MTHHFTKPVAVRRWEVILAFVIVTVSFTVGLVIVTNASDRTAKVAAHAAALTAAFKREQAENRVARSTQIQVLHAIDVRNCQRIHALATSAGRIVEQRIREAAQPPIADLTADQRAAFAERAARRVSANTHLLDVLRKADCTALPPIPPLHSEKP